MTRQYVIILILAVQVFCAAVFIMNILSSVVGFAPIDWELHEYIEIAAAVGLVLGIILGGVALRRTMVHAARMEEKLRAASSAFFDLVDVRFGEWGLTPAECDVALFAIKGFGIAEIAQLRGTSEGTIKAQTNAIYRKAGVSGRPQLLSLFIEDLMTDGPMTARPQARV
ncbi:MAG: hypothetical protein GC146_02130 [Limimaricola sp.]|uniref:helix-turn-helix transcriptional regulator n=1 Tax=Limimaricola sp. TaxID=2211665 RepID=UPI001DD03BF8|nr:helix-turn-helix transcriptional regulator [Limimaricola sp.]MBI1415996.1 hypothetical protein [Limimaricola sp.]